MGPKGHGPATASSSIGTFAALDWNRRYGGRLSKRKDSEVSKKAVSKLVLRAAKGRQLDLSVDGGEDPRLFGGGNIFGEQEGLSR